MPRRHASPKEKGKEEDEERQPCKKNGAGTEEPLEAISSSQSGILLATQPLPPSQTLHSLMVETTPPVDAFNLVCLLPAGFVSADGGRKLPKCLRNLGIKHTGEESEEEPSGARESGTRRHLRQTARCFCVSKIGGRARPGRNSSSGRWLAGQVSRQTPYVFLWSALFPGFYD